MEKGVFYPKDGRKPIEVSSTNDIRNYMGEIMDGFGDIEIYQGMVMTYKDGMPICIGHFSPL